VHTLPLIISPPDNYRELPEFDAPAGHARDRKLDLIQLAAEEAVVAFTQPEN
jgi:hypothetical protein